MCIVQGHKVSCDATLLMLCSLPLIKDKCGDVISYRMATMLTLPYYHAPCR